MNKTNLKMKIKNEEEKEEFNVDNVIETHVKPVGLWQLIVAFFAGFNIQASGFLSVFVLGKSQYRCKLEPNLELILANLTFKEKALVSGPSIFDYSSKAHMSESQLGCYQYAEFNNSNSELLKCTHGYEHMMPDIYYPDSLVAKWNLICDDSWKVPFSTTMYMLGMLVGYILGGQIGGIIGRRRGIILLSFLQVISINLLSVSWCYEFFNIMRFFSALTLTGSMVCFFVLLNELTLSSSRSLYNSLVFIIFGCHNKLLLVLVAYFIPNWRLFNILGMMPGLIVVIFPFLLPESPRWLISQGRRKEAIYQLYIGYKVNHFFSCFNRQTNEEKLNSYHYFINELPQLTRTSKVTLQRKIFTFMRKPNMDNICNLDDEPNEKTKNGFVSGILKTFGTVHLALKSIKCIVLFSCQIITYFGLLFYTRIMKGSIYLTASLNGLMAIPSALLSFLLYKYCKSRKWPLISLYITADLILLISGVYMVCVQPESDMVLIVGANIGFLLLSSTQGMLMIYIPELFPSDVRAQGLGNSGGFGRMAGAMCDFVNQLDSVLIHGTPLIIYSAILIFQIIILLSTSDFTGENLQDLSSSKTRKTCKKSVLA